MQFIIIIIIIIYYLKIVPLYSPYLYIKNSCSNLNYLRYFLWCNKSVHPDFDQWWATALLCDWISVDFPFLPQQSLS